MNNTKFLECAAQARRNYANYKVSNHDVKKSYMDVYPMSWENPKEDCGYGGVISVLYFGRPVSWTHAEIQYELDKNPTSNNGTFQKLRAAGLIKSTGYGYALTELGEQYAQAWLDDEDVEDNTQCDEAISCVAQSINCCAAAISCVAKTIGNGALGFSISALQRSVDKLMKSI